MTVLITAAGAAKEDVRDSPPRADNVSGRRRGLWSVCANDQTEVARNEFVKDRHSLPTSLVFPAFRFYYVALTSGRTCQKTEKCFGVWASEASFLALKGGGDGARLLCPSRLCTMRDGCSSRRCGASRPDVRHAVRVDVHLYDV